MFSNWSNILSGMKYSSEIWGLSSSGESTKRDLTKPLLMVSSDKKSQPLRIQPNSSCLEGALALNVDIFLMSSTSLLVQYSLIFTLNGLFQLTSAGCALLVKPGGIIIMVMFSFFAVASTSPVRWPVNSSNSKRRGAVLKAKLKFNHFTMISLVNQALVLATLARHLAHQHSSSSTQEDQTRFVGLYFG